MDGYRLAPHGRVLNDFVFMRLAWNPDLTYDQLVSEMAGYLTDQPANRAKVAEAIVALDKYWEGTDQLANIDRAAQLFDEAKTGESSYQLEYTADMLSLLPGIHRLNQPGLAPDEAEAIRKQLFAETQRVIFCRGSAARTTSGCRKRTAISAPFSACAPPFPCRHRLRPKTPIRESRRHPTRNETLGTNKLTISTNSILPCRIVLVTRNPPCLRCDHCAIPPGCAPAGSRSRSTANGGS